MQALPERFAATAGTQEVDLPVVPLSDDVAIALFMTIDRGVRELAGLAAQLADSARAERPEIVVGPATLAIPLVTEATRSLGLDDFFVLQKTPKIHLSDAVAEEVVSTTTSGRQRLLADRRRVAAVEGRRVLLIDDVLSTGSSMAAAARLVERIGGEIVAIRTVFSEGSAWRDALGPLADRAHSLGELPLFRRGQGEWREDWS